MTVPGSCTNEGEAPTSNPDDIKGGITKDECFKQCEGDPSFSGCTHLGISRMCIQHTGKITGSDNNDGRHLRWKCHYRSETGCKFQIKFVVYIIKQSNNYCKI